MLLSTNDAAIRDAEISVLVRGDEKAKAMTAKGLKTVMFESFDDHDTIKQAASEHDRMQVSHLLGTSQLTAKTVVLHTASGFHTGIAKSLLAGLAQRKQTTGQDVFYMHASGTSNVSDSPILGLYPDYPDDVWRDSNPTTILKYLRAMNEAFTYPQRTTDLTVIDTGKSAGVKTYIFICPILYGEGLGDFHKLTHQIPDMMRRAELDGYAWIVGNGDGIKNHIHIADLAHLFETFLSAILEGKNVPFGEDGIFFAENGEHSWQEVGDGIARAGVELGILKTDEVRHVDLEEATKRLDWHDKIWTESGFVSR